MEIKLINKNPLKEQYYKCITMYFLRAMHVVNESLEFKSVAEKFLKRYRYIY